MRHKGAFLKAVLDATRLTEKVLFFYGKPPKLQNPMVLHEHIKLFRGICTTIGKPLVGAACLESTQSLLGSLAAKQSDEVFKSAKDSLDRLQQWLREQFPVETGPICNWPWTKAPFAKDGLSM